jgi:hypothetical protein
LTAEVTKDVQRFERLGMIKVHRGKQRVPVVVLNETNYQYLNIYPSWSVDVKSSLSCFVPTSSVPVRGDDLPRLLPALRAYLTEHNFVKKDWLPILSRWVHFEVPLLLIRP